MTTIPQEAVKAAAAAIRRAGDTYTEMAQAALTAALPHLPGVGVKKLAWIRPPLSDTLSRCDTDFGTYRTWTHDEANGKWFWSVEGGWNEANGEALNEEAAKAAAQADYSARILSALEPSAARELALEQIRSFNPREEVEAYEFRGDNGDYTPSEAEKVMLEDFAAGLLGRVQDAVFSRTPGGSTNDE
ncbi:hypothetical protein [Brucella oryzae]|uniref:Uncharacterized protein n=1 Tax=Brucella oryzae TaxID=335286 RepID=A0A2S7IUH3_9HYPH|nr:hypothetical protein [Brucella oryzae]PQA71667.1 hypothetical protein C3731_20470 [Brucella oryzae]